MDEAKPFLYFFAGVVLLVALGGACDEFRDHDRAVHGHVECFAGHVDSCDGPACANAKQACERTP